MSLLVQHPGAFTTVQDLGRPGYRAVGVPTGGAFDRDAHDLANALLGNEPTAATLEMTLLGGSYLALDDTAIALAGAPMAAEIVGAGGGRRRVSVPSATTLRRGERLTLGGTALGARAYLAVAGGFRAASSLGSRSSEVTLKAGDRLDAARSTTIGRTPSTGPVDYPGRIRLRYIDGIDDGPPGWDNATWHVDATSGRMGVRLAGPAIATAREVQRLSMPTAVGAIQIAGGRPIVLGPACGTLGGYPVVGTVISADLCLLGQASAGVEVGFRRGGLEEARAADFDARERRRRLALVLGASATIG